jgi:hypothetical protein
MLLTRDDDDDDDDDDGVGALRLGCPKEILDKIPSFT